HGRLLQRRRTHQLSESRHHAVAHAQRRLRRDIARADSRPAGRHHEARALIDRARDRFADHLDVVRHHDDRIDGVPMLRQQLAHGRTGPIGARAVCSGVGTGDDPRAYHARALLMLRSDFAYDLPADLIAQEPRERGRSRMLVLTPPLSIEHDTFANFPKRLQPGDVLVLNDTRVIPARLYARPKGAMKNPIEFLLTRERGEHVWETWCKPAKRVKPGDVVTFSDALRAHVLEKDEGTVVIRFEGDTNEIERLGIPP